MAVRRGIGSLVPYLHLTNEDRLLCYRLLQQESTVIGRLHAGTSGSISAARAAPPQEVCPDPVPLSRGKSIYFPER